MKECVEEYRIKNVQGDPVGMLGEEGAERLEAFCGGYHRRTMTTKRDIELNACTPLSVMNRRVRAASKRWRSDDVLLK